ncbi:hypothetical protein FG87_02660 [Nocardia vulneris]|uniref:Uncharacterized protein n=1 Tax=Nocardia vulneris TaxID=1141657 RepID=A0ABR4ZMN7_9NOCA|nr:hypothetical protein FG87_02660 [Nocardia vulneris]
MPRRVGTAALSMIESHYPAVYFAQNNRRIPGAAPTIRTTSYGVLRFGLFAERAREILKR